MEQVNTDKGRVYNVQAVGGGAGRGDWVGVGV